MFLLGLIIGLGVGIAICSVSKKAKQELIDQKDKKIKEQNISIDKLKASNAELKNLQNTIQTIEQFIKEKCDSYPHLAGMMADIAQVHYDGRRTSQEEKNREVWQLTQSKKIFEYKLAYIEKLCPDIEQIFDMEFIPDKDFANIYETIKSTPELRRDAEEQKKFYKTKLDELVRRYNNKQAQMEAEIERKSEDRAKNLIKYKEDYLNKRIAEVNILGEKLKFHPELLDAFYKAYNVDAFHSSIMQGVLNNAFSKPPRIEKIDIYARIHSTRTDDIYRTTLSECSCPDNGYRDRPCKHMLYLAYLLGLLQMNQKAQRKATEIYNDLGVEIAELRESISKEREKHKKLQSVNIEVQNAINEKPNAYPRISGLMADLVALQFKESEIYLRSKTPPAHKAADEVARMREKVRAIEKRNVEWEEKIETLHHWFPNIDDVFNKDFKPDMWELEPREPSAREIKDYISKHLNAIKYNNLH